MTPPTGTATITAVGTRTPGSKPGSAVTTGPIVEPVVTTSGAIAAPIVTASGAVGPMNSSA